MRNREKAITLIALVLTIIVLLILAGVTISTLSGENGLLNRAKTAKETSQNASVEENTTLADYETTIDETIAGTRTEPQTSTLITNYNSNGTETKTNETLDGKPIYAKYYIASLGKQNHNIASVDKIWIDFGNSYSYVLDGDYQYATLPTLQGSRYWVNSDYVRILSIDSFWNTQTFSLLLKYTKTTD